MLEGQVYDCRYEEKDGEFFLELVNNPSIKSDGDDLEECKMDMYSQIIKWNGDGEAVLELLPPLSKKTKMGMQLYVSASYNDWTCIKDKNFQVYKETCPVCKYSMNAERNEALLEITRKPKASFAGVHGIRPKIFIYSDCFVSLLTKEEQLTFEKRPVIYQGKECGYWELLPKHTVMIVGPKGASYMMSGNWKCIKCGRNNFIPEIKGYRSDSHFIKKSDMDSLPSVFFIDDCYSKILTIRNDRWSELKQYKKETRGAVSSPVILLEPQYVFENPPMKKKDTFGWVDCKT